MFSILVNLAKQLLPTGRAFKAFINGELEKLIKGIALSEERFINDARAILFSILADNNNFTTDDADDWERRLGMKNNPLASLNDRKAAILRKFSAPGITPGRGHYLVIEHALQMANFNVYVYENFAGASPNDVSGGTYTTDIQYDQQYYGQVNFGQTYTNKIVNRIDESGDLYFDLGGSYKCSFFIGGPVVGPYITPANVPLVRKDEFRELILKLKQVQNVGFLFINYT